MLLERNHLLLFVFVFIAQWIIYNPVAGLIYYYYDIDFTISEYHRTLKKKKLIIINRSLILFFYTLHAFRLYNPVRVSSHWLWLLLLFMLLLSFDSKDRVINWISSRFFDATKPTAADATDWRLTHVRALLEIPRRPVQPRGRDFHEDCRFIIIHYYYSWHVILVRHIKYHSVRTEKKNRKKERKKPNCKTYDRKDLRLFSVLNTRDARAHDQFMSITILHSYNLYYI